MYTCNFLLSYEKIYTDSPVQQGKENLKILPHKSVIFTCDIDISNISRSTEILQTRAHSLLAKKGPCCAQLRETLITHLFRCHWWHIRMSFSLKADAFLCGGHGQNRSGLPTWKGWKQGEPGSKAGSHAPFSEKIKAAEESYSTTAASQLLNST